MTDPDLNALLDAATPGPWEVSKVQGQDELRDEWHIATGDDPAEFPGAMWIRGPKFVDCDDTGLFFTPADAALIVAAVNAYERLLEIERAAREWMDADWAELQGLSSPPGAADLNLLGLRVTSAKRAVTASLSPQEPTP